MKLLSLARSAAMLAGVAYFACAPATALADEKPANQEKHLLRYKFDDNHKPARRPYPPAGRFFRIWRRFRRWCPRGGRHGAKPAQAPGPP